MLMYEYLLDPVALRMAKTQWSSGHSECNMVNNIAKGVKPKLYNTVKFIFATFIFIGWNYSGAVWNHS